MAIIKWDPFDTEKWFDDELGFFGLKLGHDLAIDVYEEKGNIVAKMLIPEVPADKIDISIDNDLLRISGCREKKEEKKEKEYYHKEIRKGAFERIVKLPCAVDATKATAECSDGILKIWMPKKEITKSNKIKINIKK